jgi:hypothetical protein
MIYLDHDTQWQHLANPGQEHTTSAIEPLLAGGMAPRVLNCATTPATALNLTEFSLPDGLTVKDCLHAAGSGLIPECLRNWDYAPRIRAVNQPAYFRMLPAKYKTLRGLPWFENTSPAAGLGINARHIRHHHDLWQQLKPKTLRGVHTTLVLAMPQIGYALAPHIQLEKSFLNFGALGRGMCAAQLFPARYLFPDACLGSLADAPAPIFADLLPATCGYAWPCVDSEPDPWRVLTHYEGSNRYYGYPFHQANDRHDVTITDAETGAMLLPNGSRVQARSSVSQIFATLDPHLGRQLKLNQEDFERETGLLRGTVTHDGLPFQLPVAMQCLVYAVIVGAWQMDLDRPGDLTSYALHTRHAAIRGFNFYQRMEPYYSNFMRLVTAVAGHPDFRAYPMATHLTDSWLGGNVRVANRQTKSELDFGPQFMRSLYRQQLDWQVGVTNLMNHLSFRTSGNGHGRRSLAGREIERKLNPEGLIFHQMQRNLRFDSHLFDRPAKKASLWPNHHPGWQQMDCHRCSVTLPKL